jgi:hypothetical protein
VLPDIVFSAAGARDNLAKLQDFFHGPTDGVIKNVASFDRVARAAAQVMRAREEVTFGQADLLVYLMTLLRSQQSLEAREVSTRESTEDAPELNVAAWDVASHRPTALCSDPISRLGVRQYIFEGLARVRVLLSRLHKTFDFVFGEEFVKCALGSLRGDVDTRQLWAPEKRDRQPGGVVPAIKRRQYGRGKAALARATAADTAAANAAAAPRAPQPKRAVAAGVASAVAAAAHGSDAAGDNDALFLLAGGGSERSSSEDVLVGGGHRRAAESSKRPKGQ